LFIVSAQFIITVLKCFIFVKIKFHETKIANHKLVTQYQEISNFPMHYNVNGDTLYVIFVAVSKNFRRNGVATKLISEVEAVARKYKVKRIRLVAKDGLVDFYSKFGFSQLSEMPAFLKGKPYRSVLMEKGL
jgi:ribosomal protein S18 acetylase RimI-like enzyme